MEDSKVIMNFRWIWNKLFKNKYIPSIYVGHIKLNNYLFIWNLNYLGILYFYMPNLGTLQMWWQYAGRPAGVLTTHSVVSGSAASASSRGLSEVQLPGAHPTPTESGTSTKSQAFTYTLLKFEKHWLKWSTTKFPSVSQPSQPKSASLEVAVQIKMWPQVLRTFRNGLVTFLQRKLVVSVSCPKSKLKCPYSFVESHGFKFILDLYSLLSLPMPVFFSKEAEPGFWPDLAVVKRTQTRADFIGQPTIQKWWLTPVLSLQIYSCIQGRPSFTLAH